MTDPIEHRTYEESVDHLKRISRAFGGSTPLEQVLHGHLWIEIGLRKIIEHEVSNPEYLNLDRMSYSNKLRLVCALGWFADKREIAVYKEFNNLRNRLAHDFEADLTDEDVENLIQSMAPNYRENFEGLKELHESLPIENPFKPIPAIVNILATRVLHLI